MAAPHPIVVDVHLAEHVIDLLGSVVEIGQSPPELFQRDDAILYRSRPDFRNNRSGNYWRRRSYLFIVEPIKGFPQIHDLFLRRPVGDHGARDSLELVGASVSEDVLGNSVQTLMHHLAFSIWVLF